MQNIVVNMREKFHNDRLRNDRALVLGKSDNNNKNNVRGAWRPVSELKNIDIVSILNFLYRPITSSSISSSGVMWQIWLTAEEHIAQWNSPAQHAPWVHDVQRWLVWVAWHSQPSSTVRSHNCHTPAHRDLYTRRPIFTTKPIANSPVHQTTGDRFT